VIERRVEIVETNLRVVSGAQPFHFGSGRSAGAWPGGNGVRATANTIEINE
jgi:N-methylhydantoinase B/oxoprolinase/acetone carboxylase alpha subunit